MAKAKTTGGLGGRIEDEVIRDGGERQREAVARLFLVLLLAPSDDYDYEQEHEHDWQEPTSP